MTGRSRNFSGPPATLPVWGTRRHEAKAPVKLHAGSKLCLMRFVVKLGKTGGGKQFRLKMEE
jgi:hypothetical protein